MVTIPITSCECERFFSLLRLLKSTIRTTMTEVRLNGLALMKYHQDIKLDPDDKARVLQFLDMLSWISFALCTHAGSAPATASHALGHPCWQECLKLYDVVQIICGRHGNIPLSWK